VSVGIISQILIPLDGSVLSESAIPLAISVAGSESSDYMFVSVASPVSGEVGLSEGESNAWQVGTEVNSGDLSGPQASTARYLADTAARFPEITPLLVVGAGDPATEIERLAAAHGADLVAIASRGRSGMVRGLLGSVTDRLLQISRCPMLVTRPGVEELRVSGPQEFKSLIIPLDGSELSEHALGYGGQLASKLEIPLQFIRCVRYPTLSASGNEMGFEPGLLAGVSELESSAAEYLNAHAATLSSMGVVVDCNVAAGHPRIQIAELANELPDPLIVMTSHGSTGLTRWALGSVADGLLRTSTAPILILPQR
jgi:nucleotide-binding universal stress UspA family protein